MNTVHILVQKVKVQGNYNESSSKAFKILAGYIFGKNKGERSVSMTSPVQMKTVPTTMAMTSPVELTQEDQFFTMAFVMPAKYSLQQLPEPIDKNIIFEEIPPKKIAAFQF